MMSAKLRSVSIVLDAFEGVQGQSRPVCHCVIVWMSDTQEELCCLRGFFLFVTNESSFVGKFQKRINNVELSFFDGVSYGIIQFKTTNPRKKIWKMDQHTFS